MAIKIRAAQRLLATRRKKKVKARPIEVDQYQVDLLMPAIFDNAEPANLSQKQRLELRMPYPYAPIWTVEIFGNQINISVNAETHLLWVCVKESDQCKAFTQAIAFGSNIRQSILLALEQIKPRMLKWYSSL